MSTSEQRLAVPDDLASPQAKLVYLMIQVTEEITLTDLQRSLALSKLTLLPILASLTERGLIRRTEEGYVSQ